MKQSCPHCHQNLKPVHPVEIKRAVQLLVVLSREPKKPGIEGLCTTGNSVDFGCLASRARTEAAYRLEPDHSKWSREWTTHEYNLAAQILSDGWLPAGYIVDKEKDICNCAKHKDEYIDDPAGHVSRSQGDGTWIKCRRVTTPVTPTHSEYFCPLNQDAF